MEVTKLDHIVLTVKDIQTTVSFYTSVLGMKLERFGRDRVGLTYATGRINLHEFGNELEPKAGKPTPGSSDLCFIVSMPLNEVRTHVESVGVTIIKGPVVRTGSNGPIESLYFRDPDQNLIEVANEM